MEGLIKQARSRFRTTEELGTTKRKTPTERTPSLREKGPQKWFRRQFSRQMSSQQSSEEADYAAAVAAAAAAIAITSLEDDTDQREIRDGSWTSLPRTRSQIPDINSNMAEPGEQLRSYTDKAKDSQKYETFEAPDANTNERIPENAFHPLPSTRKTSSKPKKRLTFADQLPEDSNVASVGRTPSLKKTQSFGEGDNKDAERIRPTTFRKTPTVRKIPTFGEEVLEDTKRRKPEFAAPDLQAPVSPPAVPPLHIRRAVPPKFETEVDAWERQELGKIKERYEKLSATILEWEDKKKKKARHKLEAIESELNTKRAKVMYKYQTEMEQIKEIADGARAQAKDKKRNDELKVKEKANRYRETGQLPKTTACRCW